MKKFISAILITLMVLSTGVVGAKVEQYSILGQYETGDIVENDGDTYICVEHMKTNQCSFGEDYEPGVWSLWEDTWELVDGDVDDEDTTDDEDSDESTDIDLTKNPASPQITTQSKTVSTSSFSLNWEIANNWNPGKTLKIYENNKLIKTTTAKTGDVFEEGSIDFSGKKDGKYAYYLYLCNKSTSEKCTKGNTVTITVKWAKVTDPIDEDEEENEDTDEDNDTPTTTLDRDDFPTFKELPRNRTFTDYEKSLETSLKNDIKNSKLTRTDVRSKIAIIDKWLTLGYSLNRKGQLTGEEKRSILILQMTKKILEKYD